MDARIPVMVLAAALAASGLAPAATDGYPPPPGPYPFEPLVVEPADQAGQDPADAAGQPAVARPAPAAAPRPQATNLFGAPPKPRVPASPPARPAAPGQPYRFQSYTPPGYAAPPAFANPRPFAPARPQPQTATTPRPSAEIAAPAPAAPARTNAEPSRTIVQSPEPLAGGSRFRPPEPGE
jgi:hypothetical protein